MQNSQPASAPLPLDLEPDNEWKLALKMNIEAGLCSMVDEAKRKLNDALAKGIIGPKERERLTADHLATLKIIRQLAEEQFWVALERERQARRWTSGEQLDRAWSESMMKEQQAILDRIEREMEGEAPATSLQSDSPLPPERLERWWDSQLASAPLPPDLEPDDEWKQALKMNIEAGLRSMVDEAKQKLNDALAKGIIGPEERERLTADYLATLKINHQLAEEQFPIALERERQERRWASGEQLDRAWSESMMKEQQAILDRIERERKNKASTTSLRFNSPFQFQPRPDAPPSESSALTPFPSNRKTERVDRTPTQTVDPRDGRYFSRPVSHERDDLATSPDDIPSFRPTHKVRAAHITSMGSWNAPSVVDTERSFLERSKPSSISNELESKPRCARTSTNLPNPTHKESIRRRLHTNARPIVQEFWKPSVTPEEDAQMSHLFTPARRSSTASVTSSFKAPSILSVAFTDPLEALSADVERERTSIYSVDQEWTSSDRAREKDGGRERTGHGHTDDRSMHGSNHRFEDRIGLSLLPIRSPSYATYPQPGDGSRVHVSEAQFKEEGAKWKEKEARPRELGVGRKEEGAKGKEQEANLSKMIAKRNEEEARRQAEELRKREDELRRRQEDLNHRGAGMRHGGDDKSQAKFRKREEEICRRRAEERKKQEVPPGTFRPTPSPQTSNSSRPNRDRSSTSAMRLPTDRVSTSASGRSNPTSGATYC